MNKNYQYYLNDFLAHLLIDRGLSLNTKISYERDLTEYLLYLQNQSVHQLDEIRREHVQQYLITLYERNLNTKSVARHLSAIRSFHQYLMIEKISNTNPCELIESPKLKRHLPEILSIDEVEHLLSSFNTKTVNDIRNKAMVELMYASGLRVSELLQLKLDDVHLSMMFVRCVGKGDKERIVPIGEVATELLQLYLDTARPKLLKKSNDWLFLNRFGEVMTRQGFWKILKKQAKEAGIE
ncbi:tyrosine-type recombinase/integrase, partial [Turicibacter sanguinis]